ncbi:M48 family metalloprotease [Duganella sp. BK701]|uniref:M48 family metalloprotease n=1 Tax=Duganella sp. BK701 TaxID=2512166 RepID=UPI00210189E8|nr:M48 family metalloprotease [Duganella sp. BK701]
MHCQLRRTSASKLLLTLSFWITHRLYAPLMRMFGAPGTGTLADPAGLPLLSLILTLCFLVFTPLTNGIVRLMENQADVYSLEHAEEPDGMAIALLRTANYRAASPGRLEEWLFYDHPAIARRIERAVEWKRLHGRG